MAGRIIGRRLILLCALLLIAVPALGSEADRETLWSTLSKPGHVVLMRHADAPGTGDPASFRIGDCATQRNLGERGRAQSRHLGEEFRRRGITVSLVLTSQWCRARETARLMDVGPVEDEPVALNSFFGRAGEREAATAALRRRLATLPSQASTVVMISHQVNITALTGMFPASGEMIVLRRAASGEFSVIGRLPSP
ncbi:histidine phosphatase family protein [Bosea sp. PAMC 26642]|uniref:histidine phosphatase family protein n=1 Tax=Bosea sp. (strain PAMC 26642) TaxID=1792307 RepID=UPI000770520B|nr:histidine phosphatase family protein [Bosea sp. PAMC 26642]AMJ60758.1 hypothetical protein AXW83_11070 [Bosea sp. PAMC 26642]